MTDPRERDRQRAAFLDETCRVLWPEGSNDPAASPRRPNTELMLLPGARRPRLVVPLGRRAAAAAVSQYGEPRSARSRYGTRALSLLLRSGAGGVVFRDRVRLPAGGQPTIESYLREALDVDLELSMYVGAPRANQKPVLQLLRRDGSLVGFAKVGISPLARRLVAAERDALSALAPRLQTLMAPRVLHYGHWREMPVLVLEPLPIRRRRLPLRPGQLAQAMEEVAGLGSVRREPLTMTEYWRSLENRVHQCPESAARAALMEVLAEVAQRGGRQALRFGAWHGDWTPWNMANTRDGLLLWDWERFRQGVPVGMDAMHHWLQSRVAPGRDDPRGAAARAPRDAPRIVGELVPDAEEARLVAVVYLAELAIRHLLDGQGSAGARLGDPAGWLVPAAADGAALL